MKKITLFLLFLMSIGTGYAQSSDSISYRDIYNFDVGDQMHYYNFNPTGYINIHERNTYLDKQESANGDTIIYTVKRERVYSQRYYVMKYEEDTILTTYIVENHYYKGNFRIDTCITDSVAENCENMYQLIFLDSTINYKKSYEYKSSKTSKSLATGNISYFNVQDKYAVGLGIKNTMNYGGGIAIRNLLYYKKGAEEWGNPLTFTNGIKNNSEITSDKFEVYPNPTYGNLTIKLPQGQKVNTISIFSVQGQLIKSDNIGSQNIDISELPEGIYLLEATLDNNTKLRKRIIKQ